VKRVHLLIAVSAVSAGLIVLQACSGDNNETDGGTDASNDVTTADVNKQDVVTKDAPNDVTTADASDGAVTCPASWTDFPDAGACTALLTPDGGLPPTVLIHGAASGTQNYVCTMSTGSDGGPSYTWVLTGPNATLDDCNQNVIGHHFASEAGASAPEWQTTDNNYVIAAKAGACTPDAGSVAWLLLKETSNSDAGTISKTQYIQRLNTNGGVPTTTCDGNNVDAGTQVQYTADYYFYGQ
jgi:hypothetical protein